jgi:integrase
MDNSNPEAGKGKRADKFPLGLHKTGQYRKRIRGRDFYFGTDPDKALAEWLRVKDDLLSGRSPRIFDGDACDLMTLCNSFMTNAKSKRDGGELAHRTYDDYYKSCERMIEHLGKASVVQELQPHDLMKLRRALSKTMNATSLGNEVTRCRVILRYGFENGLIDKPVRFGDFKRPAKRVTRREKAKAGSKLFNAVEIRKLIAAADVQMKAMILLAINCGFGNGDCGQLPVSALDMQNGWIDYPRPKTGIARRCPLWPETVGALQAALESRKSDTDPLVFRTKRGQCWFTDSKANPLSAEFKKLCVSQDVYEANRGFYALRHGFQTIGDQHGDYLSTRAIMGHSDNTISGMYRENIEDRRLRAVADHVRGWLFGAAVQE